MSIYVSIGNSDNKLLIEDWANFQRKVYEAIKDCSRIHGEWYSLPNSIFQNMCICFDINNRDNRTALKSRLANLAFIYNQSSIAWVEGETEFLSPSKGGEE